MNFNHSLETFLFRIANYNFLEVYVLPPTRLTNVCDAGYRWHGDVFRCVCFISISC